MKFFHRILALIKKITLIEWVLMLVIMMMMVVLIVTERPPHPDRIALTRVVMHKIADCLNQYHQDVGDYPTTAQGLNALLTKRADVPASNWKGPYRLSKELENLSQGKPLTDLWGNGFHYQFPASPDHKSGYPFDIWSDGPDRKPGTDDDLYLVKH